MLSLCELCEPSALHVHQHHVVAVSPSGHAVVGLQHLEHLLVLLGAFVEVIDDHQVLVGHKFTALAAIVGQQGGGLACSGVYIFIDGAQVGALSLADIAVTLGCPLLEVQGGQLGAVFQVDDELAVFLLVVAAHGIVAQ